MYYMNPLSLLRWLVLPVVAAFLFVESGNPCCVQIKARDSDARE
jgi:hypothetical protein